MVKNIHRELMKNREVSWIDAGQTTETLRHGGTDRNVDREFSHRGHRDKEESLFALEDKKLCVLCELCGKKNLSLCASVVISSQECLRSLD